MKRVGVVSVILMLAAGLLLGFHSTSWAIPYIEVGFFDGTNSVYFQDGSANDLNGTTGVVTASVVFGNWNVNVVTGLTYPNGGSSEAVPYLDISSLNATSTAAGLLYVFVDAIGYTGPIAGGQTGPFSFEAGGTLGGLTTGQITLKSFYGPDSILVSDGGTGTFIKIGSLGPFSPSGDFGGSITIPAFPGTTSPYKLAIAAKLVHDGAGTTSFNSTLQAVPEPGTLLLIGSGLLGLAVYGRKKFFKK